PGASDKLTAVGRNAGAEPAVAAVNAVDPLASGEWNIDYDTSFMDNAVDGTVTLSTPLQLRGAVLLYNETGPAYYRLYNRTAAEGLKLDKLLLAADMDLGGSPWTSFDSFSGVLDGQGHTLYGLRLGTAERKYSGFVSENYGHIAHVNFADARIAGGANAGIIAGLNHSGAAISDASVSGSVQGSEAAGGAAGLNQGTRSAIRAMNLSIAGKGYAGGITAINEGNVTQASSSGSVATSGAAAGGITGRNAAVDTLADSMSYAAVSAAAAQTAAGGISGLNAGEVTNT
ncbi:hypothetical protein AMQ83_07515, partial [Paenibacillus riograndensis]